MRPFYTDVWGNPSSVYSSAREARRGIDESRELLASKINCSPEEIVFTGGGTEADNLAVKGLALSKGSGHILVTPIEHHAVLDSARWLRRFGFDVEELPVDSTGL